MRLIRGTRHSFSAWLLAAALVAAEIAAFAHLLDHEIAKPESPCAICLHAAQLDRPATAATLGPVLVPLASGPTAIDADLAVLGEVPPAPPARGPPFPSAVLV